MTSVGRHSMFGINPRVLRENLYQVCREYGILTLRQVFYRLVARYDYPNHLVFYKYLSRWTTRWRREDPWLDDKFVDRSRPFIQPPRPWKGKELWLEKDSLRPLLEGLAMRYRVPIVVQRGFASRSCVRDARRRLGDALRGARDRGARKVLLVADFDPSGICLQRVDERQIGVKVVRLALTLEQAKGLVPRPVKRGDTRARKYVAEYRDRCWEVEALDPAELLRIVERALRREVPAEHLREAEVREVAERVALDILEPIRAKIEATAYDLLRRGVPVDEVRERVERELPSGFGL